VTYDIPLVHCAFVDVTTRVPYLTAAFFSSVASPAVGRATLLPFAPHHLPATAYPTDMAELLARIGRVQCRHRNWDDIWKKAVTVSRGRNVKGALWREPVYSSYSIKKTTPRMLKATRAAKHGNLATRGRRRAESMRMKEASCRLGRGGGEGGTPWQHCSHAFFSQHTTSPRPRLSLRAGKAENTAAAVGGEWTDRKEVASVNRLWWLYDMWKN